MLGFIKKRKKFLIVILAFSICFFLITYFTKNGKPSVIKFELQQCKANTGYSEAYDVEAAYHKEKTISHFSIDGAIEENDNIFRRTEEEVTVYHVLDVDINDIFASKNQIGYDNWDKEVYFADFENQEIGKGAIYVEVSYLDELGQPQTETKFYTNFLESAGKGSKKELITLNRECNVRILLVYEVTNKLGTSTDYFRVDYLFGIRNGSNVIAPKTIGPDISFINEVPANVPVNTDISNGSTVFNGFRLDHTGNQFYTTTVYRNNRLVGVYDYLSVRVVYFSEEGSYRIVNVNAFDEKAEFNLIVDRYKPNGTFTNYSYNGIFSNSTAFILNEPIGGFNNRSPLTMEISKDGGIYKLYKSGEIIRGIGIYTIRIKNELYESIINFEIIETVIPDYNYAKIKLFEQGVMPAKYYGVDIFNSEESRIETYCFAAFKDAYEKSLQNEWNSVDIEAMIYRGITYYSDIELNLDVSYFAEQNVRIRYTDIFLEENLIFDIGMFNEEEIPYLNSFVFSSESPIFSDKVYYLRQEDYPQIKELDLITANQYGKVFEYGKPVKDQLTQSGTYLILDTNIYGHTFAFKAYFVIENNAVIKIDYVRNNNQNSIEITNKSEMPGAVNYFKISSIKDLYDPYTIVKISFENEVDYYIAGDEFKNYTEEGIYKIVCYDRNFNYFEFEITVKSPLGNDIRLEGAEPGSIVNNSFKIYFDENCQYLEIVENDNKVLLIENGQPIIKDVKIEYDENGSYIMFEKGEEDKQYLIYFINNLGDDVKFNIGLIGG